jgi:hypothetical protein
MQDRAACWRGAGDLRKPEAQAAARMTSRIEIRKSKLARFRAVELSIADFDFRISRFGT